MTLRRIVLLFVIFARFRKILLLCYSRRNVISLVDKYRSDNEDNNNTKYKMFNGFFFFYSQSIEIWFKFCMGTILLVFIF